MSNDLIFSPDSPIAVPDYLQGAETGVTDALMTTVGAAGNRISLKGSRFRLVVNGKEEGVFEENYLDCIVLGAFPAVSRVYYESSYDPNVKVSPTCYSADGEVPSGDALTRQADKCGTCPMNAIGSKVVNGRKVKACSYFRRVAVMLAGDPQGIVYKLDVKAMSLFGDSNKAQHKYNLQDYIKFVSARNVDMGKLVTRLSFDIDASVPKLLFGAQRFVSAEEFATVQRLVGSDELAEAVDVSMKTVDLPHEEGDLAPAPQQAAPAPAPQQAAPAPAPQQAAPAPAPQQAAPAPAPQQAAPAPAPVQEVETDAELADILASLG